MYSLRDEKRVWFDGQEQSGMWAGGGKVWTKPAAAPAVTIASLYGVGLGQIPMHIAPEHALVNTSGNVVTATNMGGAEERFDCTKQGSGVIPITNGKFYPPVGGTGYLQPANAADLIGTRLFMVAGVDQASVGNLNIAGRSNGSTDGVRTNIQWIRASNLLRLLRWNGASWESRDLNLGEVIGPDLRLIEIEVAPGGKIRAWLDGTLRGEAANVWPNFLIGRIFGGYNSPFLAGPATDILSFITDGSAAMDETAAIIRRELAAKNGLTLP